MWNGHSGWAMAFSAVLVWAASHEVLCGTYDDVSSVSPATQSDNDDVTTTTARLLTNRVEVRIPASEISGDLTHAVLPVRIENFAGLLDGESDGSDIRASIGGEQVGQQLIGFYKLLRPDCCHYEFTRPTAVHHEGFAYIGTVDRTSKRPVLIRINLATGAIAETFLRDAPDETWADDHDEPAVRIVRNPDDTSEYMLLAAQTYHFEGDIELYIFRNPSQSFDHTTHTLAVPNVTADPGRSTGAMGNYTYTHFQYLESEDVIRVMYRAGITGGGDARVFKELGSWRTVYDKSDATAFSVADDTYRFLYTPGRRPYALLWDDQEAGRFYFCCNEDNPQDIGGATNNGAYAGYYEAATGLLYPLTGADFVPGRYLNPVRDDPSWTPGDLHTGYSPDVFTLFSENDTDYFWPIEIGRWKRDSPNEDITGIIYNKYGAGGGLMLAWVEDKESDINRVNLGIASGLSYPQTTYSGSGAIDPRTPFRLFACVQDETVINHRVWQYDSTDGLTYTKQQIYPNSHDRAFRPRLVLGWDGTPDDRLPFVVNMGMYFAFKDDGWRCGLVGVGGTTDHAAAINLLMAVEIESATGNSDIVVQLESAQPSLPAVIPLTTPFGFATGANVTSRGPTMNNVNPSLAGSAEATFLIDFVGLRDLLGIGGERRVWEIAQPGTGNNQHWLRVQGSNAAGTPGRLEHLIQTNSGFSLRVFGFQVGGEYAVGQVLRMVSGDLGGGILSNAKRMHLGVKIDLAENPKVYEAILNGQKGVAMTASGNGNEIAESPPVGATLSLQSSLAWRLGVGQAPRSNGSLFPGIVFFFGWIPRAMSDHEIITWQNLIDGTALTLTVVPPGGEGECQGDIDGDLVVNLADFNILATNFGSGPGATGASGDLTGDGYVDLADFNILATNFGSDCR